MGRSKSRPGKRWTNRVAARLFIGTIAVISLILSLCKGLFWTRQKTGQVFRNPRELPHAILIRLDAVLVLGGGAPKSLQEPPVYVKRRCDDAAAVVMRHLEVNHSNQMLPILCLSAGTSHVPQLMSGDGLPIWESTSSAAYLMTKHGMGSNLYVETTSYDTIGNAFFARTCHTDVIGWRRLLIVTNEFHMERTKEIFDWIFGIGSNKYELFYLSSENVGLTEQGLRARMEHEARGTKSVRENLAPQHVTLKDVWAFLHQQHDLYTATKLTYQAQFTTGQRNTSNALKESYSAENQSKR